MNLQRTLVVSIDDQKLKVMQAGQCLREYPVSTAAKGMGFEMGGLRTPTGRFRIAGKIGDDQPQGTIFNCGESVGVWNAEGREGDLILSRILRLEGLDVENRNTLERHIYIHGTQREDLLGRPASHGCVRLAIADMLDLFERVSEGDAVEILPATVPRGKLLFIDCDSTLSAIEGIDELARARGAEVFARVVALTDAAMNGEIAIGEVFPRRMEMIRPDRALCDEVAARYIEALVPGVPEFLREARADGWLPVILSGGFAPLILPLAGLLGIEHVEAVPIHFNDDGSYAGYGADYPTTRNLGKNEVIREWKKAMLPERVVMIGDGVSDLETKPDVDCFIGFGGVAARRMVEKGCDFWLANLQDRGAMWSLLRRTAAQPVTVE